MTFSSRHHLWAADCLDVARHYPDGHFQAAIFSTPYPGLADFKMTSLQYYGWLSERMREWLPRLADTAVVVQNIKFARTADGWFDTDLLRYIPEIYECLGMRCLDIYPWIKSNAPYRGSRFVAPDQWEFCWVFAKSKAYRQKFSHRYAPYKSKTVAKAASPAGMRKADVRGSMTGGHSRLNPKGAIQGNVIIASSTGGRPRPRALGGSYPIDVPDAFIEQFTQPGDWVVDICAGVCTTGVAAQRLGRNFVGIDLSLVDLGKGHRWLLAEGADPSNIQVNL